MRAVLTIAAGLFIGFGPAAADPPEPKLRLVLQTPPTSAGNSVAGSPRGALRAGPRGGGGRRPPLRRDDRCTPAGDRRRRRPRRRLLPGRPDPVGRGLPHGQAGRGL